jgi:hypothetical protein
LAARSICMPLLTVGNGAGVKKAVDSHWIVHHCCRFGSSAIYDVLKECGASIFRVTQSKRNCSWAACDPKIRTWKLQWRTQEFLSGWGGGSKFKLRTEGRENGDLGAVAPYSGVPLNLQMSETGILIMLLRMYFPRKLGIRLRFVKTLEFRGGGGG